MASLPQYLTSPTSTISQNIWTSHNCHAPKRKGGVLVTKAPKRRQKYHEDFEDYTLKSRSLVDRDNNLSECGPIVAAPRPLHDILMDSTKVHFNDAGHFKNDVSSMKHSTRKIKLSLRLGSSVQTLKISSGQPQHDAYSCPRFHSLNNQSPMDTHKVCVKVKPFNELENQNPIEARPYNQDAFKKIKMFSSQIPRDGECTIGMNVLQPSFQRMSTNKSILHYEKELISMNQNSSVDFKKDGILLGSNNYLKANNEDGERFPLHVRTQFSKLAVPTLTKHENSNKSIYERKRGNIRFKHSIRKVNIQPKANNSLTYPRCQKPRNFHLPLLPTLY